MAIVGFIPARFASTRLPGKPLSDIHGKTLIEHVYRRAVKARCLDRVIVATDDERIASAVRGFGGEACMTSTRHASGTDRIAEAVASIEADIVVNVQGDEPLLDPDSIDLAVAAIASDPGLAMATLSLPLTDPAEIQSPDVVKVVTDLLGNALYFSRSPIPFHRSQGGAVSAPAGDVRKHVGLYVYRREALLRLAKLPVSPLEQAEGLEQLRALQHGLRIRVAALPVGANGVAVDTLHDLERVRALMAQVPR